MCSDPSNGKFTLQNTQIIALFFSYALIHLEKRREILVELYVPRGVVETRRFPAPLVPDIDTRGRYICLYVGRNEYLSMSPKQLLTLLYQYSCAIG